jgi:hypothetical protein
VGTEALLSSLDEDYGTPAAYCELSRYVLGGIDLDPASDAYWNHFTVKAKSFYDQRVNGLKQPWFGKVHHNAPSNRELKISAKPFWERLVEHYLRGEVECAVWIGFQLGQLQTLQGSLAHPLQFVSLFPSSRIDFLKRMPGNAPPQPAGSPTHANYITLLPTRRSPDAARAMVGRFVEMSKDLIIGGALVRPV